jgi:hypothetical protein
VLDIKVLFGMAVPWLQQRASITIPAGDEADSHDDFKPVPKQSTSVSSAYEAIEKVKQGFIERTRVW